MRGEADKVIIEGKTVSYTSHKDFSNVPWGDLGVDIVVERSAVEQLQRE